MLRESDKFDLMESRGRVGSDMQNIWPQTIQKGYHQGEAAALHYSFSPFGQSWDDPLLTRLNCPRKTK